MNTRKLKLIWKGKGFGEVLILGKVVVILNDNGLDVVLKERQKVAGLLNCRLIPYNDVGFLEHERHEFVYTIKDRTPIILQYLKHFSTVFEKDIILTRDDIPVIFYEMEIPKYDVVLHTKSGSWSVYRIWPYFDELKELLTKQGITWLDIADRSKGRIGGIQYLNYVKNAKLYVGLETGPSHYVSSIAKNKTLIIQSGFAEYNFWAYGYQYEHMEVDVSCRPCYLNRNDILAGKGCPYNHKCMTEISSHDVFNKIEKMLGNSI